MVCPASAKAHLSTDRTAPARIGDVPMLISGCSQAATESFCSIFADWNSTVANSRSSISSSVQSPRIAFKARQTKRQLSGVYPYLASIRSMVGERICWRPEPTISSMPEISQRPVHREIAQSTESPYGSPRSDERRFASESKLIHGLSLLYTRVYSATCSLLALLHATFLLLEETLFFWYHFLLYSLRSTVVFALRSRFCVRIRSLFFLLYSTCCALILSLFRTLYAARRSRFSSLHERWYSAISSLVRGISKTFELTGTPILLVFSSEIHTERT
jgi:hypothetical protein